ncbi:hypothetical protein J4227_01590 [Candidatus Woesearchaeota archaeon]|nr:hypothetical protein [Candidatus Woesearchaeota archaeon]
MIRAYAYDDVGNYAVSDSIMVVHDNVKPGMAGIYPVAATSINNPKPTIKAFASDYGTGLNSSSGSFSIRGATFSSNEGVKFEGDATYGNLSFYYSMGLLASPDGKAASYDLSALMKDNAGNLGSVAWKFFYDPNAPIMTSVYPADQSFIMEPSPIVSVAFNKKIEQIDVRIENNDTVTSLPMIENTGSQSFKFKNDGLTLEGESTLMVGVTDTAGNFAPYATRFYVDMDLPVVELDRILLTNATSITVNGRYADRYVDKIELVSPASQYRKITYGVDADDQGTFSFDSIALPKNTLNAIAVRITDKAGRTYQDTFNIEQDSTPPGLAFTIPTLSRIAEIPIAGTTDGMIIKLYVDGDFVKELRIIDNEFADTVTLPTDGIHKVAIAAFDAAGNKAYAEKTARLDTHVPIVDAVEPAAGEVRKDASAIRAYLSDETGGSGLDFTKSKIILTKDAVEIEGTLSNDGNSRVSFAPSALLADGSYIISVVAYDKAGNAGTEFASAFSIDSTGPNIIIDMPAEALTYTNASNIRIAGRVDASIGKTILESAVLHNGAATPITSPFDYSLALAAGQNNVVIYAKDSTNIEASVLRQAIQDMALPTISILNRESVVNVDTIEIYGAYRDNYPLLPNAVIVKNLMTGQSVEADLSSNSAYRTSVSLVEGPNRIRATVTDRSGNVNSAEMVIVKDTSAPVIIVTSPAPLPYVTGSSMVNVTGSAKSNNTAGTIVKLFVNGGQKASKTLTEDGLFSFMNIAVIDGANEMLITATKQGQTGMFAFNVTSDRTGPVIQIVQPSVYPEGSYDAYTSLDRNIPIQLKTDENANCAIKLRVTGASSIAEFAPGGTEHKFEYPYVLPAGISTFDMTCADTFNNVNTKLMRLHVDISDPKINSVAVAPNPVMQFTEPLTTMTAIAHEAVRCRYVSNLTSGIQPIDNPVRKEYAYSVGKQFDTLGYTSVNVRSMIAEDDFGSTLNGTFGFYVVCKDISGRITSNVMKSDIEINFDWPLLIMSQGPAGLINKKNATLYASTNINASCDGIKSLFERVSMQSRYVGGPLKLEAFNHTAFLSNLDDGDYEYTITCTDASNSAKTASSQARFTVDTQTPAPIFANPTPDMPTDQNAVEVKGIVEVNSSVRIFVNGIAVGWADVNGTEFTLLVGLPWDGWNTIMAEVTDRAGNRNSASTTVVYTTRAPVIWPGYPDEESVNGLTVREIMAWAYTDWGIDLNHDLSSIKLHNSHGIIADAGTVLIGDDGTIGLVLSSAYDPLPEENYTVEITATDVLGRTTTYSYPFSVDLSGPIIQLTSPKTGASVTINTPNVNVAGTITGSSRIYSANLTLNGGTAIDILNYSNTGTMSFKVPSTLREGVNTFTIMASSELGRLPRIGTYTVMLDTVGPIGTVEVDDMQALEPGTDKPMTTSNPRPAIKVSFGELANYSNASFAPYPPGAPIGLSLVENSGNTFFVFRPNNDLNEGQYRFNMWARDEIGNPGKTESIMAVNFSFNVELQEPPNGRSQTSIFNITFRTSQNASCRYGFITSRPFASQEMFDYTNFNQHKLYNFSLGTSGFNGDNFFVICNTTSGIRGSNGEYRFAFTQDSVPPTITELYATPNPVSECTATGWSGCTLMTEVTAITDEPTKCRYDEDLQDFSQMRHNFGSFNKYSLTNKVNITFPDEGDYDYFVSCQDQTWPALDSMTKPLAVAVDTSIPFTIIETGPEGFFSTGSVTLTARTNKAADCAFYTHAGGLVSPKSFGRTSHSVVYANSQSGTMSFQVNCSTLSELAHAEISFVSDKTPPVFKYVNDSAAAGDPGKTNLDDELRVKFLAEDEESGIDYYQYTIENRSNSMIIAWIKTTDDDTWIEVDNLELTNGTYKFRVNATNKAGLSTVALSDGIVVDTSYQPYIAPTCTDGIMNQGEKGIDCAGPCSRKCPLDSECNSNGDCASGYCDISEGKCAKSLCENGVLDTNNGETAIDCGGSCQKKCSLGQACSISSDCSNNYCNPKLRICAVESCTDGIKNGDESGIDCGGSCDKCEEGESCRSDDDCESDYCGETRTCGPEPDEPGSEVPPEDVDTDGDGIPDLIEIQMGSNPNLDDADEINQETGRTYKEDYDLLLEQERQENQGGAGTEVPPPEPVKGWSIMTYLLLLLLVILLGGGGYYVYTTYFQEKKAPIRPGMLQGQRPGMLPGAGRQGMGPGILKPGMARPGMLPGQRPLTPQMKALMQRRAQERLQKRKGVFQAFAEGQATKTQARPGEIRPVDAGKQGVEAGPTEKGKAKEGEAPKWDQGIDQQQEWLDLRELTPGKIVAKITEKGKDIFDQLADFAGLSTAEPKKGETRIGKETKLPQEAQEKPKTQAAPEKSEGKKPVSEAPEKPEAEEQAEKNKKGKKERTDEDIFEELRKTAEGKDQK